jgi:hypothetical protein
MKVGVGKKVLDEIKLPPLPPRHLRPDLSFTAKRLNKQIDDLFGENAGSITEPDYSLSNIKTMPKVPGYADSLLIPRVKIEPLLSDYMLDLIIICCGTTGFLCLGISIGLWIKV